jgi:hypothetical protein
MFPAMGPYLLQKNSDRHFHVIEKDKIRASNTFLK